MRLEQTLWDDHTGWPTPQDTAFAEATRLALVFGSGKLFESGVIASLQARYPAARLFGCSTAGEIPGTQVRDGSLVATAIQFDSTRFEAARVDLATFPGSGAAGRAVALTGGLSADGADFRGTLVLCDGEAREGSIVVLGFHGDRMQVGHPSLGRWDSFGPERMVTRSVGNVLFELDGKPALELYRSFRSMPAPAANCTITP